MSRSSRKSRSAQIESGTLAAYAVIGIIFIAAGAVSLFSIFGSAKAAVFQVIRKITYGVGGCLGIGVGALLIWCGLLVTFSSGRKVRKRGFLCVLITFLCVAGILNLNSKIKDSTSVIGFMEYLEKYILSLNAFDPEPDGFTNMIRAAYAICMKTHAFGGAMGVVIAWPLWTYMGGVTGTIVLGVVIVLALMILIRANFSGIFSRLQDDLDDRAAQREDRREKLRKEEAAKQEIENANPLGLPNFFRRKKKEDETEVSQPAAMPVYQQPVMMPPWQNMQSPQPVNAYGNPAFQQPMYAQMPQQQPQQQPLPAENQPEPEKNREGGLFNVRTKAMERLAANQKRKAQLEQQIHEIEEARRSQSREHRSVPEPYQPVQSEQPQRTGLTRLADRTPQSMAPQESPQGVQSVAAAWQRELTDAGLVTEKPVARSRRTRSTDPQVHVAVPEAIPQEEEAAPIPGPAFQMQLPVQPAVNTPSPVVVAAPVMPVRQESVFSAPQSPPPSFQPLPKEFSLPRAEQQPVPARKPDKGQENMILTQEETQEYIYPSVDLLRHPPVQVATDTRAQDAEDARRLEQTFQSFSIPAKVQRITHGPAVTRFELGLTSSGINVKRIMGIADNIALDMAANGGIHIEIPIPGTNLFGIEVPNKEIQSVCLSEVLESPEMCSAKSPLTVALGRDIAGKPVLCDLAKMPHLLIAGQTGSGKSVCINTIINSILFRASPEEVRMIMVDPKVVELQCYNVIPHLLTPVVSDPHKAAGALTWAVGEMLDRYHKMQQKGVRELNAYNAKLEPGEPKLPRIVIIIDELADLMMACKKEVEESITRIAQLARAAGIHMVVATQRPTVDVITGLIKSNIPSRIAFAVASNIDSRTILDQNGAEKLLGKGDMFYFPTGASSPIRVQGCFLSDTEIERVVNEISGSSTVHFDNSIEEAMNGDTSAAQPLTNGEPAEGLDDKLPEAIEMVLTDGQASISMLQRRMKIGYARAGRMIDDMAKLGVIENSQGSKARKVLMSREEYLGRKDEILSSLR